jgi:hypothetical protein
MSRVMVILTGEETRRRVAGWIMSAPMNTRVEMKEAKRSLPQNDRFWASLTDIARQKAWHGVKLSPDDWKLVFLDALKQEVRIVPNLNGTGFVNLGRSSSDLSKQEMSDLLEIIYAWGAQNGVTFTDPVPLSPPRDGAQGKPASGGGRA